MHTTVAPIQILLVEDNLADVEMTRELMDDAKVANTLHVALNGDEAMDFLRGRGEHAEAPRPDLVILDLNLPGRSGREVLAEIKGDDELRTIPVVVLTTSAADEDILAAYRNHVNCYVRKPLGLDSFMQVVRTIEQFWLTIVRLPPG